MSVSKTALVIVGTAGVGAALLLGLAMITRRDERVGLHREIVYDDFGFSVLAARKTPTVGPPAAPATARGVYYVLTLQVANHAQRVPFQFRRDTARLVDAAGREYPVSPEGQRALDAARTRPDPCAGPIPAGDVCATDLVFDVPAQTRAPRFRLRWGGPIIELLDNLFSGVKRIALP